MAVDLQKLSWSLFQAANQLWTNTALRPDQYAQPVLALIALRQMEAKFDQVHGELAETFTGRLKPTPQDYHGHGAVYLPTMPVSPISSPCRRPRTSPRLSMRP